MIQREFLLWIWTSIVGGAFGVFRGDLNYHTITPSPPTVHTMAGPTHVLVHVNPEIHKAFADKLVDYYDKENLSDFTVFCRCWRSKKFPYCNGFHHEYNKLIGDNVGPLIVRRRNVTFGAKHYRRMSRYGINWTDAGTPTMCRNTPPTPTTPKRRRPYTDVTVDVDAIFKEYGDQFYNFTKYMDEFINISRITPYTGTTEDENATDPEPTLWYPTFRIKRFVTLPPINEEILPQNNEEPQ
uniref:CDGSH iron-sulfur domain-containing protein 2 homologue n=1 Tax=Cacopsylla melanoneura TaxID=428564 RepID=A0A8D8RBY6_9HEMI